MENDFKVTADRRVFLGGAEIQKCLGFDLHIEAGENPEVLLRVSCDSVDINGYTVTGGESPRTEPEATYEVKELFFGKPDPQVVQVAFELDAHGWNRLQQSSVWRHLLEALASLQKKVCALSAKPMGQRNFRGPRLP